MFQWIRWFAFLVKKCKTKNDFSSDANIVLRNEINLFFDVKQKKDKINLLLKQCNWSLEMYCIVSKKWWLPRLNSTSSNGWVYFLINTKEVKTEIWRIPKLIWSLRETLNVWNGWSILSYEFIFLRLIQTWQWRNQFSLPKFIQKLKNIVEKDMVPSFRFV